MADKTIGELKRATSLDDDSLMIAEQQGEAVSVTGGLFKSFAQESTKSFAESASADAAMAADAKDAAQSALKSVQTALNNLPAGGTLVINDLTTGGTSAALSAEMGKVLGERTNHNILINTDFCNPVNQRGYKMWTSASGTDTATENYKFTDGYTIDRWKLYNNAGTMTSKENGIVLSGTNGEVRLRQSMGNTPNILGKKLTLSMLTKEGGLQTATGTIPITAPSSTKNYCKSTLADGTTIALYVTDKGTYYIQIFVGSGVTKTILAAKMEVGSVQTLAHKEGTTWVVNEIPDYGTELARCQRYFLSIGYSAASGFLTQNRSQLRLMIPTPVTLRGTPTITACNITGVRTTNGANVTPEYTLSGCTVDSCTNNGVMMTVKTETFNGDPYVNNTPIGCYIQKLEFDCEH